MKRHCKTASLLAPLLVVLWAWPGGVSAAESTTVFQELDLKLGAVSRGTTSKDIGPLGEENSDLKYVVSPQINKDLLLRFGGQWQRFSFGAKRSLAVPDSLQQLNAVLGFDYQLGDQWLMRAELEPGIYGDFKRFDWRRFDAPLKVGFAYLVDADLQWFFGLRVDPRSQYPVFPAVGARWKFADVWTLDLQLPDPRLEYDVNDKLQAYLGVGILAGTYVVGDHFGDDRGQPRLNHATLDYSEFRLGPGFSWKARPYLTVEAEAGYVLYRSWDFFNQGIDPIGHPAPYLQIACHANF